MNDQPLFTRRQKALLGLLYVAMALVSGTVSYYVCKALEQRS